MVDSTGAQVAGTFSTGEGETELRFTPAGAWRGGRYVLRVDKDLEDPAGNSVGRPFELDPDIAPATDPGDAHGRVDLVFEVAPPPPS